jgi:hypothetical protein
VNSPACTIIRALRGSEEEPRALNDNADEEGGGSTAATQQNEEEPAEVADHGIKRSTVHVA